MDRSLYVSLGVFCLLYAVMTTTNIEVIWMRPICGIAAGVCGVICLFRAFR